ncbi:MAG: phosphoenolpyruvate hydrolase family protein, partial [Planctomycetaceae bacterium]
MKRVVQSRSQATNHLGRDLDECPADGWCVSDLVVFFPSNLAGPSMLKRSEILARLRAKVAQGRPIVGGGAGIGLSAKLAEEGGIDLL